MRYCVRILFTLPRYGDFVSYVKSYCIYGCSSVLVERHLLNACIRTASVFVVFSVFALCINDLAINILLTACI